jgi:hypothetical protein
LVNRFRFWQFNIKSNGWNPFVGRISAFLFAHFWLEVLGAFLWSSNPVFHLWKYTSRGEIGSLKTLSPWHRLNDSRGISD